MIKIKKEKVDEAAIEFCKEVIKEPLLHFSESDLHVLLIEKLYEKIPLLKKKKYDTNVNRGKNSKTFYKTRLVHREYGGGEKTRMDIVIFDEGDVKEISHPNLTKKNSKSYLKPPFAFELGTEKIGEKMTKAHVESDIKKLKNKAKCGYLIHIFRDNTRSPSNTRTREKTEQKLERKIKNIFSRDGVIIPKNVKIVFIILSPFRDQTKTWGKCKIFNKNDTNYEWVPVGIKNKLKIEKILKEQLQ